jgi:hypothetical protein
MACASPPFSPRSTAPPAPCAGYASLGSARFPVARTPERAAAPWDVAGNDDDVLGSRPFSLSRSLRATASTGMADPSRCRAPIRQTRLQHRRADGQRSGHGACLFPATDVIPPFPAAATAGGGHDTAVPTTSTSAEHLAAAANVQRAALNGSFWSFLAMSTARRCPPSDAEQQTPTQGHDAQAKPALPPTEPHDAQTTPTPSQPLHITVPEGAAEPTSEPACSPAAEAAAGAEPTPRAPAIEPVNSDAASSEPGCGGDSSFHAEQQEKQFDPGSAGPDPSSSHAERQARTPGPELRKRQRPGTPESAVVWRVLFDEAAGGDSVLRQKENDGRDVIEQTARDKRGRPTLPR